MSDTTRKYMDILSKKRSKFFQDYEHNSWDDLYEYAFDDGYDTAIESMQEWKIESEYLSKEIIKYENKIESMQEEIDKRDALLKEMVERMNINEKLIVTIGDRIELNWRNRALELIRRSKELNRVKDE